MKPIKGSGWLTMDEYGHLHALLSKEFISLSVDRPYYITIHEEMTEYENGEDHNRRSGEKT